MRADLQSIATQDCLNYCILLPTCQESKMLLGFAGIARVRNVIHVEAVAQLLAAFSPFVKSFFVLYASLQLLDLEV